jgi:hypothetical protein
MVQIILADVEIHPTHKYWWTIFLYYSQVTRFRFFATETASCSTVLARNVHQIFLRIEFSTPFPTPESENDVIEKYICVMLITSYL